MDFSQAVKISKEVFEAYRVNHPKWWKHMDGTPILNDVAVLMAVAFIEAQAAPAQPVPMHEQSARFAIDGAMGFGMQNTNKPPSDDHWLMEYWAIGRKLMRSEELTDNEIINIANETHIAMPADCDDQKEMLAIVHAVLATQRESQPVPLSDERILEEAKIGLLCDSDEQLIGFGRAILATQEAK
ncbi:hypothetical protein [Glaciimonas sp. PCH181]|uniref:hypothetical protein n=1 Tax=Glaciimonas sp. PCH181 TaxID=2133943 RepID=UPI000D38D9F6|nr:hypothetical protein [Glaciimonas sp. PCH181]PUA19624.1 hypothetical protein C7W93_07200 [Glaciimonas sp. PCH181]